MGMNKAALITGIISGHAINMAKWIAREIKYRVTSTNTMMAFPFLLIQIFINVGYQRS